MSTELMSHDEAAGQLRELALSAGTAVRAPDDLAERVLQSYRRRRRLKGAAWGVGAVLAVAGSAAAASLGTSDFFTVTQPSPAMSPTLEVGENVVASRSATPRFGEVVIVRWTDEGLTYEGISRVMGLEGDVVSCPAGANGRCEAVLVNGEPVADPYLSALVTPPFAPTTVPADSYFLLGDDRRLAKDSRHRGPLAANAVDGVVVEIVDVGGERRAVPGAPPREGPTDGDLVDPAEGVPNAPAADPAGK